jgi:hypothetical protein
MIVNRNITADYNKFFTADYNKFFDKKLEYSRNRQRICLTIQAVRNSEISNMWLYNLKFLLAQRKRLQWKVIQ